MAKLVFNDKSSVEIKHSSDNPDNIVVIVSAIDAANKNKRITNACELTAEEFKKLMADVS
jgi:hypothetical protein